MTRAGLMTAWVIWALACAALLVPSAGPAHAAFPGANGDVAFQAQHPDEQAATAYAAAPGGAGMRRLLFWPVYLSDPHWSPDGSRAVSTSADEEPDGEVHMVAADGSYLANVTKTPRVHESYASWFPSGTRLVYCANPTDGDGHVTGPIEIRAVSVDAAGNTTGPPKRLATGFDTAARRGCGEPVVSPDNSKIAFVRDEEVRVMRTGSPEGPKNPAVNLTKNSDYYHGPDWSPDGRKIVYTKGGWGTPAGVWVMNGNGSNKKFLGSGRDPAFSPNGRKIAFVDNALQYSVETGGYEMLPAIWTMRTDGTGRTMIIGNEDRLGQDSEDWGWMYGPSWQPRP